MFKPGMNLRDLMEGDGRERVKPEKNEWPFVIAGILLFFVTLFLYVYKFNIFSQTIHGSSLIKRSLILGLIVGAILSYFFSRGDDRMESFRVYAAVLFMCLLAFPLYAHLINFGSDQYATTLTEVEIIKNDSHIHSQLDIPGKKAKPDGYYLHFLLDDERMYLRTDKAIFIDKSENSIVQLPIRKGRLGYGVIDTKALLDEH